MEPQSQKRQDAQIALALAKSGRGGGSIAPLARTFFVDPQTAVGSPDGSIAKPFATVAAACARVATLVDKASPVGIVVANGVDATPYAIPDGFGILEISTLGTAALTGAGTWNVAGGGPSRVLILSGAILGGGITVTDDGATSSAILFESGPGLGEALTIDASGATDCQVLVDNAFVVAGVTTGGQPITVYNAIIAGPLNSGNRVEVRGCVVTAPTTFTAVTSPTTIFATKFDTAVQLAGSVPYVMDGQSYASWLAAGGTLGGTAVVQVQGMADMNRAQDVSAGVANTAAPYVALQADPIVRLASGTFRIRATATIANLGGAGTLAPGDAVQVSVLRGGVAIGTAPVIVAPAVAVAGVGSMTVAALVHVEFEDVSGAALGASTTYALQVTSANGHTSGVDVNGGIILISELPT